MHRVDADTFIPPQVTTFRGDSSGGYQTFQPQCRDAGEPTLPLEIWRIAVASYYYHGHSMREDKGIFYFFFLKISLYMHANTKNWGLLRLLKNSDPTFKVLSNFKK